MVNRSDLRKVILDWKGWFERTRASAIARDMNFSMIPSHALVLIGVRRSGKSFSAVNFIRDEIAPIFYMNFEDPVFTLESSVNVLDEIISVFTEEFGAEPGWLVFDEIQNIDSWERWIRKSVDLNRYKIILSGSSAKLLSSEVATSLTGRGLEKNIWPLSFSEFLRFTNRKCASENEYLAAVKDYIEFGAFPEVVLQNDKVQKTQLLRQYLNDIVSKDIINRYQIRSKRALDQIVAYYLTNISSLHSYNSVKNAFNINLDTVSDYTKYLEECFLLFEITRYHPNMKVIARDPKKIYCVDTGLRNANSASMSQDIGKLVENVVFVELKRRGKVVSYFKGNYEVDFVLTEFGKATSIVQVCYSDLSDEDTFKRETRAVIEASKELKLDEATIITQNRHEKLELERKRISLVPLYEWLLKP